MCNSSVIDFVRRHAGDARGLSVLEIGSYNVNGSVRSLIEAQRPEIYIGTDLRPCDHVASCRCVDLCVPSGDLVRYFRDGAFGLVICTEVLEHTKDWKTVIANANRLLDRAGRLVLTTRSPGFPYHEHPGDYWRFTPADMRHVFGPELLAVEDDPSEPGVCVVAGRTDPGVLLGRLYPYEVAAMKPPA